MSDILLNPVQEKIAEALKALGDRSRYSEAVLAKKIRETAKLDGKKKAGISLADLEKAVLFIEETCGFKYSLIMNSANDLLIEKSEESKPLSQKARTRRLKSEKSMTILTSSDFDVKKSGGKKGKSGKAEKRFDRKALNTAHGIDSDFE